ncbi:branched-subunit amino acid aminotransferase/4-amino-4-deoxychorismate lyase [Subtercola boreus]|nr:branched-subunit amino acid aminotransferase/4-amino-4-deoxychorismate lyase [Subtercola boreus]
MDARRHLEVADSWLVDSGRVRAVDLHRERFFASAAAAGFMNETLLAAFWDAALGAIPPVHRWFPRVELSRIGGGVPAAGAGVSGASGEGAVSAGVARGSGSGAGAARWQLSLLMRLAPPLTASAVLRTYDGPEPRSIPSRKGPDLATLNALRDAARADGVDDLVLLGPGGAVVDGTTTALLWWRGDTLCAPAADLVRVDSVTAKSVRVLAAALGVTVSEERAAPADLAGTEVWAVNALHGIRVVTAWRGGPAVAAVAGRAALWQRRIGALARPLAG